MSSEVQLLTDEQIQDLLNAIPSEIFCNGEIVKAAEQAVRAQWAAEVERIEFARTQFTDMVVRSIESLQAERDYAQAEAMKLRGALETAVAALADGLWDYGPGQDEHDKCNEVLAFCRAALQPGATLTNPRAGETA